MVEVNRQRGLDDLSSESEPEVDTLVMKEIESKEEVKL